jgi:hypothetical protein
MSAQASGYPIRMDTVLSLVELVVYIGSILGISIAATWAVIKISPSESAREQARARKEAAKEAVPPA